MSENAVVLFEPIEESALVNVRAAANQIIQSTEENSRAILALSLIKRLGNAIEARRAELKRPHLEAGREIDAQAKKALDPLADLEKGIKHQIADWDRRERERIAAEQRRIAEENERRLREAREAAERERARVQAETAQLAAAAGMTAEDAAEIAILESAEVKAEAPILDVAPVHAPTTRTAGGAVNVRMRWTFAVASVAEVPIEYCSPDPVKIRRAVEAGVRNIPGVRIYEEAMVSARAAR